MIGNALRMFNVHPIFRYFSVEPPKFITRYIRRTAKGTDTATPLFLGALTVFIPCGVTQAMMATLERCGLQLEDPLPHQLMTPQDWEGLFPATGGALYGRASHGWAASFQRQGPKTSLPGLYCTGGATHPAAGVPMAALSGQLAARVIAKDLGSTKPSRRAATAGGMSMRSVTTGSTG